MTVSSTTNRIQYNTNGTTGPWTVPYVFLEDEHLAVTYTTSGGVETALTLSTHYSVTGAGDPAGGTVTTVTAYASGGTLTILRDVPATQELDLVDGDALPAESLEQALDKLTMIAQVVRANISSAIRTDTSWLFDPLPDNPSAYGGYYIGLTAGGQPTYLLAPSGTAGDLASDLASASLSGKGAGQIGYDSSLAYADATVGGRLNYFTTPTNAVADGTTDDYAELQQRITDAPTGGTLLLQPGKNYRIATKLVINKALTVIGYGAKLNTGAAHITAIEVTASDVQILGLEIEGGGNGSYNTAGKLIVVTGTANGAGVAPTRIRRVLIRDCHLYEAGRCGVQVSYAERVRVENNAVHDVAYCGIEFLSCNESWADGNDIRDVTPGTAGNMYGIYFSQVNDADTVRYPQCEQVAARHNHIENIDWEGLDCHGGDAIDFSHNAIINCGDSNAAIAIIHADDAGSTPIVPATNVRIVGNTIQNAQHYGIALSSGSATVIHSNVVIVGNTLENCGASDTSNDIGGIRIGAARNVTISDNALDYCAPYGVVVNVEYAAGVVINGNTFRRIVSNTETTPAPILIDRGAAATGAIVIGSNTLLLAAAGETYEAVNGVRVVATDGGNIRVLPNNFDLAGTQYSMTAAQWDGASFPVVNAGSDTIAVTTGVATASKVITLATPHSANTVYVPTAVISASQASDERTILHCVRTSTTQITVTVYTAGGANFAANGNISIYYETKGL